MGPVVSVSITVSISLLLVDYQTSRVSSVQQSVFLSLGLCLFCWQTIRPRGYHGPSSQCFYHQVYTSSVGRLLDLEGIICPVVSVSITRSMLLLLVDYQTSRVSSVQQSVFLSLGLYLFCWQTIRPRGYHLSSSQCFYHCVDTSSVGRLLDLEGIIRPVVSVSINRSIPLLLVDYQSSRVSSVQQSVFLPLGRYLFCWQTISPRGYHPSSSQFFYHKVDTSSVGRLLDLEGIIRPVVSVSITMSLPLLLVDYQSSRVSSAQQSVFLSLGRYLFCWQTISTGGYHPPSSHCFYHQVYISSVGRLLVLEGIIAQQSVFLSLGRYLFFWQTISPRGYHRSVVSDSITRSILLLLVDYQSSRVSSVQQSVFLSLGLYLFCWQTIRPRGYHLSSSQCFYHQVYTSSVGRLLDLEGIICPVVSVSITVSIPLLLVHYQTSRVSSVQQSVFLSLGLYLFCWQTIRPRGYHLSSSQCFYHCVDTSSVGRLLDLEGIICPVVSVSITRSIPLLLVDYQTSRVSSVQQSVFLSLGLYLFCWQTIRPRGYHLSSSQCFYHQVDTSSVGRLLDLKGYHLSSSQCFYHCVDTSSVGRLLDLEGIICPVVSVSITRSIPLLLVDYQTSRVSFAQQSVFLSLGRYLFCWQTISPRGYHPPSSQCFYHQVDTSSVGRLLDLEGIIRSVVSVSITRSIPLLLVDYQSSRVSSAQQSVFLSLGRYLFCWQTIRPRGYHLSSSQCFYHQVYTSSVGRLLVPGGIIRPVVSVSITRFILLLLVDYQSSRVSSPSSQCFYHQVDTSSFCRLLVLEGIIRPVDSFSITRSIPLLLVDYQSSRVSSAQQSVILSLGLSFFCWQTISPRRYHLSSSQCFYHQVNTSSVGRLLDLEGIIYPVVSVSITVSIPLLLVDYQTSRVSSVQQSVFLSLGIYLFCWQTIRPRGYHPPSSQCFYHQVATSSVGRLLVLEGIIRTVVRVSITRLIPLLLVDYQSPRVSSVQQSVFLSLGLYLFCWQTIRPRGYHPPSSQCFYQQVDTLFCWQTISPRGYHPSSSQCFYHQVDTSSVGRLLVLEGIIRPVVSFSITRSIPLLLVDYQTSRVSSAQQSVFLSLCRYLLCWQTISPRGYHPPSSQCFYHQVYISSVGRLLVLEGIIAQQSVFLSIGRYLFFWQTISPRGYHPLSSQ